MSLRRKLFGDKAFYKMVLAVAVPIMIQNGITNFVGLLDNIMVGRVGTEQMSGIAIVNQLLMVFNLSIFGAISGAGIFGAQFYGCQDHKGVRHTFRFKLYICLFILLTGIFILTVFGEHLILMYLHGEGQEGSLTAALGYGKEYLWIMLPGLLPFVLEQIYTSTLRECGETMLPMKAGIVAVLVNLALNWLLIFGSLGFPKLGVAGAAIATVVSRFVQAAIVVIWTHRHSKAMPFITGVYKSGHIPGGLAGKMDEAKETDTRLIAFSVFSCLGIGGVLFLMAPLFPMMYNTTEEVKALAAVFIRIAALCMPLAAFMHASYFTLRSGGKTVITFLFDSVFLWCVSIPLAYALSRYTMLPIAPLYLCCQLVDIVKCVIGFILVKKGVWIHNIVENNKC